MPSRQQVIDRLGLAGVDVQQLGALSSELDPAQRRVSARLDDVVAAASGDLDIRAWAQPSHPSSLVRLHMTGGSQLVEGLIGLDDPTFSSVRWLMDGSVVDEPPGHLFDPLRCVVDAIARLSGTDWTTQLQRLERANVARSLVQDSKTLRMDLRKVLMEALPLEVHLLEAMGWHARAATLGALVGDWQGDREGVLRTARALCGSDGPELLFPAMLDPDACALVAQLCALEPPDPDVAAKVRDTLQARARVAWEQIDAAIAELGIPDPVTVVQGSRLVVTSDNAPVASVPLVDILADDGPTEHADELAAAVTRVVRQHQGAVVAMVQADRQARVAARAEVVVRRASRCRHLHGVLAELGGLSPAA